MDQKGVDKKKYGGKYIALKSFDDFEVIVAGESLDEVYDKAVEKGVLEPVIDFIPKEGVVCIF
jgi:hypothetical protein